LPVFAPAVEVLFPTAEKVPKKAVPSSQGLIKAWGYPRHTFLLWLLRNSHRKRAQTSSQKTPQKEGTPQLAQMGRVRQKKNQKLKTKPKP